MTASVQPSGVERTFGPEELIVSKTDSRGRITYANDVFLRVSRYAEHEVLGRPHNIIRHPDMPRSIFQLMWSTIQRGDEVFAYVLNLAADGAQYWVLAHITATRDPDGTITGYHSNRRRPADDAIGPITELYATVRRAERRSAEPRQALDAGMVVLQTAIRSAHIDYDQYVWSLIGANARDR
ncbi:MAG: PAS domain-containing protein [Acidimicrobiia bacterium]